MVIVVVAVAGIVVVRPVIVVVHVCGCWGVLLWLLSVLLPVLLWS